MVIFEILLKPKSDQNIHQSAPNCTILKKILGGMPPNPPTKTHGFATCKFPNLKKKIIAPPLPNPGDAPDGGHFKIVSIIKKKIKFVHIRPYIFRK